MNIVGILGHNPKFKPSFKKLPQTDILVNVPKTKAPVEGPKIALVMENITRVFDPTLEDLTQQIQSQLPKSSLEIEGFTTQPQRLKDRVQIDDVSKEEKAAKSPSKGNRSNRGSKTKNFMSVPTNLVDETKKVFSIGQSQASKNNSNTDNFNVICAAIYATTKTQKQPQSEQPLLLTYPVVQVVKKTSTNPFDKENLGENGIEKQGDQVVVKKTSTNPFDKENLDENGIETQDDQVVVKKTSTNPFDLENLSNNSTETLAANATKIETLVLPELNVPKEGLNHSDAIAGSGEITPSKPTYFESMRDLFQNLTLGKVLKIAAGALMLSVIGTAAYHFYPVVAGVEGATALGAGRAAMANIGTAAVTVHESVIQPGLTGTMFITNLIMKMAVIPAAKVTMPVLLAVISTAVVTTLGTLAFLYVANRVWEASKTAIWGACAGVANKVGEELDRTYVGQGVKYAVLTVADPYIALMAPEEQSDEVSEEARQLQATDSTGSSKEEIVSGTATNRIGYGSNVESEEEEQTAPRVETKKKVQRSFVENALRAGLYTAGFGALGYFAYNYMQKK